MAKQYLTKLQALIAKEQARLDAVQSKLDPQADANQRAVQVVVARQQEGLKILQQAVNGLQKHRSLFFATLSFAILMVNIQPGKHDEDEAAKKAEEAPIRVPQRLTQAQFDEADSLKRPGIVVSLLG